MPKKKRASKTSESAALAGDMARRALDLAQSSIEKSYGKGSIMWGDATKAFDIYPSIPTGSLGLDKALGIGGIPQGRIIEIYGSESAGKTTLALQIIAQSQAAGGIAAFVDMEHALDVKYAKNLGVKMEDMLISQPDNAEQALEIIDTLGRCGAVDIIVLDSVAALVPKAELNGNMGDSLPGLQARMMSQALRKLTAICAKTNTNVIFINQIRYKIGVMFGNPETTAGGNALKFYASIRLDIRRIGALKKGEEIVGNRTRVKVVKNKMAPPFQECEFDIIYGKGIDFFGEVVDAGVANGTITKSGAWYSIGDERLAQGRPNAIENIQAWPEIIEMIAGEHYSKQILIEEEKDEQPISDNELGEDEQLLAIEPGVIEAEVEEEE